MIAIAGASRNAAARGGATRAGDAPTLATRCGSASVVTAGGRGALPGRTLATRTVIAGTTLHDGVRAVEVDLDLRSSDFVTVVS